MATVMTSPRRPSLPTPSTVTHVHMGYQAGNQSHDAAPPLPSRDRPIIRRQTFETNSFIDRNTARAYSDPNRTANLMRSQSDTQHHGNAHHQSHAPAQSGFQSRQRQPRADDPPPPPLPSSRPPTRPPPQYESAPPPPPIERIPLKKQTSKRDIVTNAHHGQTAPAVVHRQQSNQDVPPALPPARPPKTSVSSSSPSDPGHTHVPSRPPKGQLRSAHSFDDFESRFRFHDASDFPEPDSVEVSKEKGYPSKSIKRKNRKIQEDGIGSL